MKYIDADKLIAEIRKLCSESCISEEDEYYEYAKSEIIDIITSLQQEQPVEGLEEEMDKFFGIYRDEDGYAYDSETNHRCLDWKDDEEEEHKMLLARHFYELGCRHTAVMYDDIEHERQRAEEEELSGDLEDEIDRFIDAVDQRTGGRWSEDDILECARHFAEWGAENLKK